MIKTSVADRLLLLCIMAGLALSVYSALETFLPGLEDACSPNSTISCRIVNESPYSHIGPLPVWTFGVGGFVFLLALDVLFLRTREARWLTYLFMLAGVGLIISVVLTLVEIFLIGAICPVCVWHRMWQTSGCSLSPGGFARECPKDERGKASALSEFAVNLD